MAASITAEGGVRRARRVNNTRDRTVSAADLERPTFGEAPKELAAVSRDAQCPTSIDRASYPPRALGGGVVMFEVSIDERGTLTNARTIHADPGFENASRAAFAALEVPRRVGRRASRGVNCLRHLRIQAPVVSSPMIASFGGLPRVRPGRRSRALASEAMAPRMSYKPAARSKICNRLVFAKGIGQPHGTVGQRTITH